MLSNRRPGDKYDVHYALRDRGWYLKLDRDWVRASAEEVRERLGPELNRTPPARYNWYDNIPDTSDRELATKIGPTICRTFSRDGVPVYGSPRGS